MSGLRPCPTEKAYVAWIRRFILFHGKQHPQSEPLGHRDLTTTMIYTHVLNRGPAGARSPVDRLLEDR